jgi:hypothetical protein
MRMVKRYIFPGFASLIPREITLLGFASDIVAPYHLIAVKAALLT